MHVCSAQGCSPALQASLLLPRQLLHSPCCPHLTLQALRVTPTHPPLAGVGTVVAGTVKRGVIAPNSQLLMGPDIADTTFKPVVRSCCMGPGAASGVWW